MTCSRCSKERLTLNGLCNDCNNKVDAQTDRNLPLAQAISVAIKAAWNWQEETNGTRAN